MATEPKKQRLTPSEARRKFGELLYEPTRTYRHFEADDGDWRPELSDGELTGYRWYKRHKIGNTRWRQR